MEKPQQYHILAPHEIIQEGDEFLSEGGVWMKVGPFFETSVGLKVSDYPGQYQFRRPLPPETVAKSATVECPGPDCQMCSGEYCAIHMGDPCDCDVIDRHKLSPVKESLSVEDESSDNSRSFQEIERLNRVIESLRKQHKNRNPTYAHCSICSHLYPEQMLVEATCSACWKLRAEKAEALRDTAYSARDAFADLYTKECELRRTAERERDEAKSKVIGACSICWTNSWSPADANEKDSVQLKDGTWARCDMCYMTEGLKKITKERDTLRAEKDTLQKHRDEAEGLLFDKDQENARLREALQNAAKVFRDYEEIHRAKGTLEADIKAESNALQAERLESALAGKGAQS